MTDVTALLLKHGIEGLLFEDNESFKDNIIQALSIKLNETVAETKELVSKNLMVREYVTQPTQEVQTFLNFVSNFVPGPYTFQNGVSINITESEISSLKGLFESLNPQNRQQMVSKIFTDTGEFRQHIKFSQKVNKLL